MEKEEFVSAGKGDPALLDSIRLMCSSKDVGEDDDNVGKGTVIPLPLTNNQGDAGKKEAVDQPSEKT